MAGKASASIRKAMGTYTIAPSGHWAGGSCTYGKTRAISPLSYQHTFKPPVSGAMLQIETSAQHSS